MRLSSSAKPVQAGTPSACTYPRFFVPSSLETSNKRLLASREFQTGERSMAGSVAASEDDLMSGRDEERKRGPRKPPFKFLVPLIYAPVLPLIRIGLRKQPVLRDRVFTGVLAAALLHGGYLVTGLYDVESK